MRKYRVYGHFYFVAALSLASGSLLGQGSDSPVADNDQPRATGRPYIEEVIVTARRREESLQEVPVAVTALSGRDLAERGISTGVDLQGQIPSLVVNHFGQARDVESFTVRGQSQTYTAAPAVVQYLAEVPLISGVINTRQGGPGQFLDLASVQVLRGPQGTLFGRNSTGGAILLEPEKPTDDFSGHLQVQAGNFNLQEYEGVVNFPILDTLKIRIAGRVTERDGFTKDVVTGTDYDNRDLWTARIGLVWQPTDRIDNYFMLASSESKSNGTGNILQRWNIPYLDGFIFSTSGGCLGNGLGFQCSELQELADEQRKRGERKVSLGPSDLKSRVIGRSAIHQFAFDINESITLRNILSYSEFKAYTPFDGDGSPLAMYDANLRSGVGDGWTDDFDQITEELQLQGTAFGRSLDYTLGIYYETIRSADRLFVPSRVLMMGDFVTTANVETESTAAYAHGSYDLGSFDKRLYGLSLSVGARYTWDKASGFAGSFTPNETNPGGLFIINEDITDDIRCTNGIQGNQEKPSDCEIPRSTNSTAANWTAGVDYQFNPDILAYTKVTRGYKTGGLNPYAVSDSKLVYEPEFVNTIEGGIKSTFDIYNLTTQLNFALFHTRYKDIQVATGDFDPDTFASGAAVVNAGRARISGIEVEGIFWPFDGLELSFNYSHLDGKYKEFEFFNEAGQVDCSGEEVIGSVDLSCLPLIFLPRNQYSLSLRYSLPIPSNFGHVALSVNYAYLGAFTATATTLPELEPGSKFDSNGLLNLSVSWQSFLNSSFDLALWVTNARDETYRVSNTGVFQSLGVQSDIFGEPRMFGARLRYGW